MKDRILLSRTYRSQASVPQSTRRSPAWTIIGGVLGATILFWVMVQLGQAAPGTKGKPSQASVVSGKKAAPSAALSIKQPVEDPEDDSTPLALFPKTAEGPALEIPREVIEMMNLRKNHLDRREETIKQDGQHLLVVKEEIEQLLARNEAIEKKIQAALAKEEQQGNDVKAQQAKTKAERERQVQEQKTQLAKMYESMPSEEAAARLERIPDKKAVEILRLVKTKTAGSILAQVKVDRAAKLTEQLLVAAP